MVVVATGKERPEIAEPLPGLSPASDAGQQVPSPAEQPPFRAAVDGLQLWITDPAGEPLAGVLCVVYREEEVLRSGRTGPEGGYRCEPSSGHGFVALASEDRALHRASIDVGPGIRHVELPDAEQLAGHVLFERKPAAELQLHLLASFRYRPEGDFPRSVWMELARHGAAAMDLETRTDADGGFAFRGLPASWRGSLCWAADLRLESVAPSSLTVADNCLALDEPQSGILLNLRRNRELAGRVVEPATGSPVAGARVRCALQSGAGESLHLAITDSEGRFHAPIDALALTALEVTVRRASGSGERKHAFAPPVGLPDIWRLGDLEVAATRVLEVVVTSQGGDPIEGATVVEAPQDPHQQKGARRAPPTDPAGRCRFEVPATVRSLRAGAHGYAPRTIPVPVDTNIVNAQLSRASLLEIHLTRSEGPLPQGLLVQLTSTASAFSDTNEWIPDFTAVHPDSPFVESGSGPEGGYVGFRPSEGGRVSISGLRPGIELTALVVDANRSAAARHIVAPLQPGEHRLIEIPIEAAPRTLAGRVVDADGVGIARAQVRVGYLGSWDFRRTATAADGTFAYSDVLADNLVLIVMRDGYAPFCDTAARVEEPPVITLTAGHSTAVRVEDHRGLTIERCSARVRYPHSIEWTSELRGRGDALHFVHLPAAELELAVQVGAMAITRRFDPSVDHELTVVVPEHGMVRVDLQAFEFDPGAAYRLFLEAGTSSESVAQWIAPEPQVVSIPAVPIGDYVARLERRRTPGEWEALGVLGALTVRANELAQPGNR
jgi:hypothetical protein